MKISQKNFMIAWENKKLIHGALKYAHVRQDYDRYDDLYQNAVLIYAEMLEKHSDLSRESVDKLSFNKIIWKTLNELHKVKQLGERNTIIDEALNFSSELNYDELLILKDEFKTLNEIERAILTDHIAFQGKMTELDKKFPVCRMTLQRMKKRLLTKLRSKYQK